MKILGIIPSRYKSTRFPGKPLAMIGKKSMIQRVYEQSSKAIEEVFVATDDKRIFNHVKAFGGNVVMTSETHKSGTDRCREAMESVMAGTGIDPEIIVNIQGDEPFIKPDQIGTLISCFDNPGTDIATLLKKIEDTEEIFDENKPKVVFNKDYFALYFSRSPIPFLKAYDREDWIKVHDFYRHIGIYAYRKEVLEQITLLEQGDLERAESLEQLRWLENGYFIKVAETDTESIGIDTPEDLKNALKIIQDLKN